MPAIAIQGCRPAAAFLNTWNEDTENTVRKNPGDEPGDQEVTTDDHDVPSCLRGKPAAQAQSGKDRQGHHQEVNDRLALQGPCLNVVDHRGRHDRSNDDPDS